MVYGLLLNNLALLPGLIASPFNLGWHGISRVDLCETNLYPLGVRRIEPRVNVCLESLELAIECLKG